MRRLLPCAALTRALAMLVSGLAALVIAAPAGAAITPASVVVAPNNALTSVDGAALAPDGTGGILYTAVVGGISELFVVPISGGHYGAPVAVDPGNPYDSTQPSIAAGEGGRLMVVWVQPFATPSSGIVQYELNSAELEPGAAGFAAPIQVSADVSEPYTGDVGGVDPDVAMEPDGQTYVVYRVIEDDCGEFDNAVNPYNGECGTGNLFGAASSEVVAVDVAETTGGSWSSLGEINEAPQLADPPPTAANAPQIAAGDEAPGSAVVVWQEPDGSGYARIWARWIWGTTLNDPLQLSPSTWNGQPVDVNADAPAISLGLTAQAAYRLDGGTGSPFGNAAQVFLTGVPVLSGALSPSQLYDVGSGGTVGAPSVAAGGVDPLDGANGADSGLAYGRAAATVDGSVLAANTLTSGDGTAVGTAAGTQALVSADPYGGGLTAWQTITAAGAPVIAVSEDDVNAGTQSAQLAGDLPGPITGLSLGDDDNGDGLLAWMQGSAGDAEIVADFLPVAPQAFTLTGTSGWALPTKASIAWDPAADATAVTYAIDVDGIQRIANISGPAATAPSTNPAGNPAPTGEATTITRKLSSLHLTSGVHQVTVIATNVYGGQASATVKLKVDGTPPAVRVTFVDHHRGVRVRVRDPDSGVKTAKTVIKFGDGATVRRRNNVKHLYARAGRYRITATVRDKAGNHATVHLRVRVK